MMHILLWMYLMEFDSQISSFEEIICICDCTRHNFQLINEYTKKINNSLSIILRRFSNLANNGNDNYKIKIAVVNIFCKTNKINGTAHCGIYTVVAMICGLLPHGDF